MCASTKVGAAFIYVMITSAVLAQTGTGSIQGTAKDVSGAVVPKAQVIVQHIDTGNQFTTQANEAGFFVFPAVQAGRYSVAVKSPGMEEWKGDLQLQTGQEAVVEAVLRVGGTATQMTVAGDVTSLVTTTNPTLATVVERARIEELPLNGRHIEDLMVQMAPGLEGGLGASPADGVGNVTPQPYGLRDGSLQFVQDGVSLLDANLMQLTSRPPGMDIVQEFRIEMSVPSAKYSAPATALLSTRSGTNQWHGSLFYTGRNNGFGVARQRQDFYTKPPQLIRNEYGASLGGPVKLPHYDGKDRTFFFFGWEALSLRQSTTISTSVPTPAMEQGNFSQLTNAQGLPITLYDPRSTAGPSQNSARVPYVGNIIPLSERSPLAAYVYGVYAQANQPGVNPSVSANWFGLTPAPQNDWTYTWRIDHRLGERDQIFGRYTIGNDSSFYNNGGPITTDELWNAYSSQERMQTGSFTWNHTFSPTFFLETLGTGADFNQRSGMLVPSATQIVSPQLGVPNPFNVDGAPSLSNFGWSLRAVGAIPRAEETKPIAGEQNYTLVRGRHQIEFGWRVERLFLDILPDRPGEGSISFDSQATGLYDPNTGTAFGSVTRTGDNSANFFLGIAGSYSQTLPLTPYAFRSTRFGGYAQDNWRLTSRLTLNLGLRYEYFQPLIDQNGSNAGFDFANHAIVRTASNSQLIQQGATTQAFVDAYQALGVKFETTRQAGLPSDLVKVSQRNFNPRLGLAYDVRVGKRSFVLRGGYGEYHFPLETRLFNAMRNNPPLQGTVTYNINSAALTPDGLPNLGLRSVPTVIAGTNSAVNAISPNAVTTIARGIGVTAFAPNLYTSLAREWNATFETEILRNTLFRVAYVGTAGRHLDQDIQYNGAPNANPYVWYATSGLPMPTGAFAPVALRDYDTTTYGIINTYGTTGYSNYNGMQVEVQRRFNNGLAFQWYYVLSNAMWVGSGNQIQAQSSILPDPVTFLPGSVPANFDAYNRFYNYSRDPYIPKHRVNWNMLYDLPVGKGKRWLANSGGFLNRVIGGWQLAAQSTMNSQYVTLPTTNWGPFGKAQVYGTKYPIQDCRSGPCIRGYLWYNGYIPPDQINTQNAAGRCTGVCGVPSNYQPADQPIDNTPGTLLYGTNNVNVPLKSGAQQLVAYNTGLNPFRNQYIPGPWAWTVNGSLFKVIPIKERLMLRLNMDFFNVLNMPGTPLPNAGTGITSLQNSSNIPRQLQWTLRLNW